VKCYLKDKALCGEGELKDENNCLTVSPNVEGMFHKKPHPSIKIWFLRASDSADSNGRFEVTLRVEFFSQKSKDRRRCACGTSSCLKLKEGSRFVSDMEMETTATVRDPDKFKAFMDWKSDRTSRLWEMARSGRGFR